MKKGRTSVKGMWSEKKGSTYRLVQEGLFKSVRIGNAIRISKRSFDHWLESLDL